MPLWRQSTRLNSMVGVHLPSVTRPNTRVQRTRSSASPPHSPLTRHLLGGRRYLLAAALTVAAAGLQSSVAEACSCTGPSPPLEALAESRGVFLGKVVKIEDQLSVPKKVWAVIRIGVADLFGAESPEFSPRWYGLAVTFDVSQAWKGDIPSSIVVLTPRGGGDCGFPFRVGESYMVYLRPYRPEWPDTDLCTRTRAVAKAEGDLTILGPGMTPRKGE